MSHHTTLDAATAARHVLKVADLDIVAIIIALNEESFIEACIHSVYPFCRKIVIVTNYDHDYGGKAVVADQTVPKILAFDDVDRKICLLINREIYDETIQRNWAMRSMDELSRVAHLRILPHRHPLDFLHRSYPAPDYYWIVDADEMYDHATVPGALELLASQRPRLMSFRGHNFFKTWNHRISLASDNFRHVGFVKAGESFWSRRLFFAPRPIGWLHKLAPRSSAALRRAYTGMIECPEDVAHFYHGAYVGDDARIAKKLDVSSHAGDWDVRTWFLEVWKKWTPASTNFGLPGQERLWSAADHIPTADLPVSIRQATWPDGWIERDA